MARLPLGPAGGRGEAASPDLPGPSGGAPGTAVHGQLDAAGVAEVQIDDPLAGERSLVPAVSVPSLVVRPSTPIRVHTSAVAWRMTVTCGAVGVAVAAGAGADWSPLRSSRAIDIGERLEVLKDYPTSPGCASPFAPIWITEMVPDSTISKLTRG